MHRSIEVLGFHQVEREVHILIGLYVENRLAAGTENYLRMLHRRNVECFVQRSWPLPAHPDEFGHGSCVLEDIYGDIFEEAPGQQHQVNALTAWDARVPGEQSPFKPWWPTIDSEPVQEWGWRIPPETPVCPLERYAPFTTWRLGPFTEATSYLVTCTIRIPGTTYEHLVQRKPQFSVDGPERLLSRIKYDDVFRLADQDRASWEERLAPFEQSHLLVGEEYDVIILNPPLADKVDRLNGSIGIVPAPRQPIRDGERRGERFMTADQAFNMTLRYARSDVETADQETVVHG